MINKNAAGRIALAISVLVLCGAVLVLLRTGQTDRQVKLSTAPKPGPQSGQGGGYPPPLVTVTPSPTPDEYGLIPPPASVSSMTVEIDQTSWAPILTELKTALHGHDAATLASWVDASTGGVAISGGTHNVGFVSTGEAQVVFEEFFANGSVPRLQGYFDSSCIKLFITGWVGTASLPVRVFPPNRRSADIMSGPTFGWQVCQRTTLGPPLIANWVYGPYHELVGRNYEGLVELRDDGGIEDYLPITFMMLLDG